MLVLNVTPYEISLFVINYAATKQGYIQKEEVMNVSYLYLIESNSDLIESNLVPYA